MNPHGQSKCKQYKHKSPQSWLVTLFHTRLKTTSIIIILKTEILQVPTTIRTYITEGQALLLVGTYVTTSAFSLKKVAGICKIFFFYRPNSRPEPVRQKYYTQFSRCGWRQWGRGRKWKEGGWEVGWLALLVTKHRQNHFQLIFKSDVD